MKQKQYHREQLDTFDEVLKEMQILRDEVVVELKRVDSDNDKLASIIGKVCRDTLARLEAIDKRLQALEPKKKAPLKKPPKKKKK